MTTIFKKLLPEIKPHARMLAFVIFVGILVSALRSATPYFIQLLEESWKLKDFKQAMIIPFIIAASWVIASVGRYYHLFWMKYISDLIAVELRRKLMQKYLSLNLSYFQGLERGSGGLISRMLNDIAIIQSGITRIADLVREPFTAIFMLGYLVWIDWKLFIFIVALAPFITAAMRKLAKSLRKYSHQNQESVEDLTKVLKESLDGTRIVQSFNLEPEMNRRFDQRAKELLRSKRKIISREEASGPISESLASISMAMILVYIGTQLINEQLSLGDFLAFITAVTMLQDSLKKIQNGYIQLQQSAVAMDRVQEVLDTKNELALADNPKPFPKDWQQIEFRDVTFAYPGHKPVLNHIHLVVQRGEAVALVGSSGGGKSTLINLLMRFFDPVSGSILIGGIDLREMDLRDLRQNIGLVSQDVFLFGDTLKRNIQAGDFSKDESTVEHAARMANAHDFIMHSKGGYDAKVGEMGSLLSGGEKQRISIARAIYKDAPILILDEATSALDTESEREVQKGLDRLMEGRTAFVIAHRLSTIANADRILVLKGGQVIEEGSHEELLKKRGEYFRLV
ncbi:MAG: ABC transporter ATP-binding protein [Bdellovibrionales bacterium]|nr:ABC transporter ATP-binding protein [Bdellovibrionales bacterium]